LLSVLGCLVTGQLQAQVFVSDIAACDTDPANLVASKDLGLMTRTGFQSSVATGDVVLECIWDEIPEVVWEGETILTSVGYCKGGVPRPAVFSIVTTEEAPGQVAVITSIDRMPIYKFLKCD